VRRFAALFDALDTTTSTNAKVDAMLDYFQGVSASDAAWAMYILIGRRLKRVVGPSLLREWLKEEANLPAWLVDETYGSVGDLAETIALLVPGGADAQSLDLSLTEWFNDRILPLSRQSPSGAARQRRIVVADAPL
jgi:DNA ligase-1